MKDKWSVKKLSLIDDEYDEYLILNKNMGFRCVFKTDAEWLCTTLNKLEKPKGTISNNDLDDYKIGLP